MKPLDDQTKQELESLISVNAEFAHDLNQLNAALSAYLDVKEKQAIDKRAKTTMWSASKRPSTPEPIINEQDVFVYLDELRGYEQTAVDSPLTEILLLKTEKQLMNKSLKDIKSLLSSIDTLYKQTNTALNQYLQIYNGQPGAAPDTIMQFKGIPVTLISDIGELIYQLDADEESRLAQAVAPEPSLSDLLQEEHDLAQHDHTQEPSQEEEPAAKRPRFH